jgi:putative flavoprotein involved in K+ transport
MYQNELQPPDATTDAGGATDIDTVVIGGGQAGLAVGHELARRRQPFVILDAHDRIGDAWRQRWDSLRLFTPARFDGLPGFAFPAGRADFITKDEMADYLEAYAERFALPVLTGMRVDRLSRDGERFVVSAAGRSFVADNVVVAMSGYQQPKVPPFASGLDPRIVQLHSLHYRNPSQLTPGGVLVVGVGNSGADIALEVAASRPTWLAGQETGHIPFRIERFVARHALVSIVRFVRHHVLTIRTPVGRKSRPQFLDRAAPLIRVKPRDLVDAGIQRVGRIIDVHDGHPVTEDGEVLDVTNVIWATGFRPGFGWIDLPIFGDRQEPEHRAGIVQQQPGLYFVGLHFLYAATSDNITGVARDARRVVRHLTARRRPRQTAREAELIAVA